MTRHRPTPPIQSLDRGLQLIEAVANARRPLSLADLTPVLGIDRSSVFRLAHTLQQRGFLAQLPGSKHYVLGSALWRLADLFQFDNVLLQLAREPMDALAAETGETTHLAIREGHQAMLVGQRLTTQAVGVAGTPESNVPLHCTSVGKALIADFDRDRLAALFGDKRLSRHTKRTLTTLEQLAGACQETRERGFAVDDEEQHEGVRCVAAHIRDASGQIVGAIGISAPAARLPRESLRKAGAKVVTAAARISRELGNRE